MINDRIEQLLNEIDMSPSLFADAIGVQRATISHILSGRNNPSLDFVQKVLSRFPELNPDWILSGTGEIWRETENPLPTDAVAPSSTKTISRQPGLFSDDLDKEEELPKKPSGRVVENAKVQPAEKEDIVEKPVVESKKDEPGKPGANEKKVVKVIILYSDNTFEAFTGI